MTTFIIDADHTVTAFPAIEDALGESARSTDGTFSSETELASLSAHWPMGRFVEVWNGFAGVVPFDNLKPVQKFTDRKTAISRIWKAIQVLVPAPSNHVATDGPVSTEASEPPTAAQEAPTGQVCAKRARAGSKVATVLDLLKRPDGANLAELVTATGWQAHSVRGFISGTLGKKMGLAVESAKREDGERRYRVA